MTRLGSPMLRYALLVAFVMLAAAISEKAFGDSSKFEPKGLGDPGRLESISIDTGNSGSAEFSLIGRDARQQLVVTGHFSSGQLRDLTRDVRYEVQPEGILTVDETGMAVPWENGTAQIHVTGPNGLEASVQASISRYHEDVPVNFPNQIVPIFTKLGCNGGGCHGKSGGQNGFQLSLLGFEPTEDYEHLLLEARGRRLFPAAPDVSLLLQKATGEIPHGGGQRLQKDSRSYALLRRWIAQGMPYGDPDDPTIDRIEVFPADRMMSLNGAQQLTVIAHYSNGSTEDVTGMVQFEANETDMAECDERGLVTVNDLTGDVAVMARYQGAVDVFRATIPLGVELTEMPKPNNFIDEFVFAKLETLGIPPSEVCDDATFIRRVCIDVSGRLPAPEETKEFLADEDPQKRNRLIGRLVESAGYADLFANKWSAILRNRRANDNYKRGSYALHGWIRESLYNNKPYDEFVRGILAASGDVSDFPPVVWYRSVPKSEEQVEDAAQLFLGMRLQCARCHHHPFEKWSQHDYYSLAAFFSRVGRKDGSLPEEYRVYHKPGTPSAVNPKNKEKVKPAGLDAPPVEVAAFDDPRHALVDWMSSPDNPFFAKAAVNRYWKHFLNRGVVEPEDDMRVTNPATNPALLDALSEHFIQSGFDLKDLVRTICRSKTYQLSAEPNDYNAEDRQNFARYYPRRLSAEVLLDAVNSATNSTTAFDGLPAGTNAIELPDSNFGSYFLTVFGRPEGTSACECERSGDANLAQSLHLLNSSEIQSKLTASTGRAARLAGSDDRSHESRIEELYLIVFSRDPNEEEKSIALAYIEKHEDPKQAYEDLLWALVNTKEFLFNH